MKKPLIILVVILTIGAVFYFIDKPGGLIDKDIKDVKTDKPIVIDPSKLGSEPLSPEEQKGLPNGISTTTTTTTTTVNTKSSVATDGPKPLSPTEQKQVVESSPAPTKTNTAGSPKTLSQEEQRKLMESNASNPPPPFPEN